MKKKVNLIFARSHVSISHKLSLLSVIVFNEMSFL